MVTVSGAVTAPNTAGTNGSAGTAISKDLTSKDTFLQLLVAQIKNQDPLNPSDGLQFVTQLAQFSELEQVMGIRQDVQAIGAQMTGEDAGSSQQ